MKDLTMVIPSYWARAGGAGDRAGEIVFDHPTPLDQNGTLGRLLDSLDIFDPVPGRIVIIAVANEQAIAAEVDDKIEEIIAPYRQRYNILALGQTALEKIKRKLAGQGVCADALAMVNMDNYASVRNICSLAGILEGSPCTVFIDDDEVFTDRDFFNKVAESMDQSAEGGNILALAGYYLQPDTYRLDQSRVPGWRMPYWNNAEAMNRAFDLIIGRGKRIKRTPFVFGGNMTLALDALKKVPFDPRITRGEDIDFLLNLRVNGIKFYLDRELAIKHLPPGSDQRDWRKLREDAVRFLYERKKVTDHHELSLDELQPYPGAFLGDDLEERIIKTAELLRREYGSQSDREGVRECENIMSIARENPFGDFDTRSWLEKITAHWQQVTAVASGLGIPE